MTMSEVPDLWPELGPVDTPSPIDIMTKQAEMLSRKTDGALEARVRTARLFQERRPAYYFEILAPSLGGYSYNLFTVFLDAKVYPLEIRFVDESYQANDDEEFIDVLKQIFQSSESKRVISGLLSLMKV